MQHKPWESESDPHRQFLKVATCEWTNSKRCIVVVGFPIEHIADPNHPAAAKLIIATDLTTTGEGPVLLRTPCGDPKHASHHAVQRLGTRKRTFELVRGRSSVLEGQGSTTKPKH